MRSVSAALVLAFCSLSFFAGRTPGDAAVPNPEPAVPSPSAAAASHAPSDARPEPAAVAAERAKVRVAEGRRPTAERVVETTSRADSSIRNTVVRVGDDERTSSVAGPFQTSRGTYRGQRWHQNANGLTILDQDRGGLEAVERRVVTLSHVTTPIVADVISDLDPKGHGTLTYVEPATSRVLRVDDVSATQTTVSTRDDFRTTDGYTRPWHTHDTDGTAIDDTDVRIESIATTGVTAAAVAIPPPRRALVTFPTGVTSVSLPCKLDRENHFIVRVTIGGRGFDFVLDTGAYGIIVDERAARSLGLPLGIARSNASNAGRFTQHEAVVPDMHVGALDMKDVAVGVVPSLSFDDPGVSARAVGLLGFDFVASLALRLDYAHAAITAIDYDAFKPPTGKDVFPLEVRLGSQVPETDVRVDGRLGERFDLDTGGAGGVMMTDIFTRRYPGITGSFHSLGTSVRLTGVGGEFDAPLYAVPHLQIGPVDFTYFSAIVIRSDKLYAGDEDDGTIGPEIFAKFTVTTDYADSTFYLERR